MRTKNEPHRYREMKRCSSCSVDLESEHFGPEPRVSDGLRAACKKCVANQQRAYRETARGKAITMYNGILKRAMNADGLHIAYAHVENRFTREQFLAWAIPAIEEFYRQHPYGRPSIDRTNSRGHYELSNVTIMSWSDNVQKARNTGEIARRRSLEARQARASGTYKQSTPRQAKAIWTTNPWYQ